MIEDPSTEETDLYLGTFAGSGEDRIVLPTPDKIVRPYKKDEVGEEKQNLVNEEQALSDGDTGGEKPPEHISQTIQAIRSATEGARRTPLDKAKREYLAGEMLAVLGDKHSLGYYRRVAEEVEPARIFEALSMVKGLVRQRRVRKSRGAAFVSALNGYRGQSP
jgi:hypothetical protein